MKELLIRHEQIEESFQEVEKQGGKFGGSALSKNALSAFCFNLPVLSHLNILELGGGLSTLFWNSLILANKLNLKVTTFEHHPFWKNYIERKIGKTQRIKVEFLGLRKINDAERAKIFAEPNKAQDIWPTMGSRIKSKEYEDTVIHNTFYDIPSKLFARLEKIGALIIDGPHGNGRSLAFPLFSNHLKSNALLLLDDFDHYDFLDDLSQIFNFAVIKTVISLDERWIILRLNRKRH